MSGSRHISQSEFEQKKHGYLEEYKKLIKFIIFCFWEPEYHPVMQVLIKKLDKPRKMSAIKDQDIADTCHLSVKQVRTLLQKLKEHGMVESQQKTEKIAKERIRGYRSTKESYWAINVDNFYAVCLWRHTKFLEKLKNVKNEDINYVCTAPVCPARDDKVPILQAMQLKRDVSGMFLCGECEAVLKIDTGSNKKTLPEIKRRYNEQMKKIVEQLSKVEKCLNEELLLDKDFQAQKESGDNSGDDSDDDSHYVARAIHAGEKRRPAHEEYSIHRQAKEQEEKAKKSHKSSYFSTPSSSSSSSKINGASSSSSGSSSSSSSGNKVSSLLQSGLKATPGAAGAPQSKHAPQRQHLQQRRVTPTPAARGVPPPPPPPPRRPTATGSRGAVPGRTSGPQVTRAPQAIPSGYVARPQSIYGRPRGGLNGQRAAPQVYRTVQQQQAQRTWGQIQQTPRTQVPSRPAVGVQRTAIPPNTTATRQPAQQHRPTTIPPVQRRTVQQHHPQQVQNRIPQQPQPVVQQHQAVQQNHHAVAQQAAYASVKITVRGRQYTLAQIEADPSLEGQMTDDEYKAYQDMMEDDY